MHDIASIFPQLKSKTLTAESAKILDSYPIESPWRRCWEFVLTHEMTETERSAFWHGAYISLGGHERTLSE